MPRYTPKTIALEIKKACEIYKMYPAVKPKGYRSGLARLTADTSNTKPFCPTPKEIDKADQVQFVWMRYLSPKDRRLVWKRFEGMPYKILAYQEGLTIRQTRYKIELALKQIATRLNKKSTD